MIKLKSIILENDISKEIKFSDRTGIPIYDSALQNPVYYKENKGIVVRIAYMSPEDYLQKTLKGFNMSADELHSYISKRNVADIKQDIERTKMVRNIPVLVYRPNGKYNKFDQEGRHRAIALKELGVENIPVAIVHEDSESLNIKEIIIQRNLKPTTQIENTMINLKKLVQELSQQDIDTNYEGPTATDYQIHAAFRKFDPETNTITFKVWDMLGSKLQHQVKFQLIDFDSIKQDQETPEEKLKTALHAGDLKVHCTCKGFTYNGFAYITHTLDANIKPNIHRPHIRNPKEVGIVCKHIKGLLENVDKYVPTVARRIESAKASEPGK